MPSVHTPFHAVQLVSIYNSLGHWPIKAFDNESMAVRIDHPTLASAASPEHHASPQHYAIQTKIKQQADIGYGRSAGAMILPEAEVDDVSHAAHDYHSSAVVVKEIPVPANSAIF